MYLLNNSFIYQRHYNVDKSKLLYEYVTDNINQSENLDGIYYVVANKDHVYEINLIGSLIIEEIKNQKGIVEIVKQLLNIYKVSFEELKEDIIKFIEYLQKINIVKNEESK